MKQYSSIVLFFIFCLCACNGNRKYANDQKDIDDSINFYIKRSKQVTENDERLLSSNKAFSMALQTDIDSLVYKALYNKIENDIIFQQNDSIDYYLHKLKNIYNENSYIASYYYLKGFYFQGKNVDSSFINYEKSQKLYYPIDKARAGYSLMMMSEIERASSDFIGAEESLTKAFEYLKNDKKYYEYIYNSFGLIYWSQYDYDEAIYNYQKAFKIANDLQKKNIIQNNLALIYRDKKNYSKSIQILDSLNSLPHLSNDPLMKGKILSNLGYVIFLSNKGDGLSYLKQAEAIQDTIDDSFGRLANYLKISDVYLNKNNLVSKNYATKAYNLAKQLKNGDDKLRALELLIKATDDKSESDKKFSEYVTLNDSINTARQISKNGFAKIKYDSSEAEKNALQSKLVAEKAEANNILLLVIVGFLAVLATVVYFFMKRKSAIDQVKASYATELRISKKVHDELANDIYNIMMYSGAQDLSSEEKKERLLGDLDSVYKRTRDISKENATIETGENYPMQLMAMLSEYQNEKVNVLNSGIKEIGWGKVEEIKKVAVYRILQELMVNMAKHSQAELCMVIFKTKGKNIIISYSDTGVGIGTDKIIFKNGLANAENRIKGIGGSLTFDSNPEKGLKMTIVFPA